MNERIQELAKQADLPFIKPTGFISGVASRAQEKMYEQFATLIVRECAKVSERTGALNEADFEGEMIADAILEHFGVKE